MSKQPDPSVVPVKKQSASSLAAAYFIARLGIFGVILGIFWLFNFRGLPGALAAAILSIPVSFFLLTNLRVRVAERMAERKTEQLSLKDEFRNAGAKKDKP